MQAGVVRASAAGSSMDHMHALLPPPRLSTKPPSSLAAERVATSVAAAVPGARPSTPARAPRCATRGCTGVWWRRRTRIVVVRSGNGHAVSTSSLSGLRRPAYVTTGAREKVMALTRWAHPMVGSMSGEHRALRQSGVELERRTALQVAVR